MSRRDRSHAYTLVYINESKSNFSSDAVRRLLYAVMQQGLLFLDETDRKKEATGMWRLHNHKCSNKYLGAIEISSIKSSLYIGIWQIYIVVKSSF